MSHREVLSQDEERPAVFERLHAQPAEPLLDQVHGWIESRQRSETRTLPNPTGDVGVRIAVREAERTSESQVHSQVERVPWYQTRVGCINCKKTYSLQSDLYRITWTALFEMGVDATEFTVQVQKYWTDDSTKEFPHWEQDVWTFHYITILEIKRKEKVWGQVKIVVLTNMEHTGHQHEEQCSSSVVHYQVVPRDPPEWGILLLRQLPRKVYDHLKLIDVPGYI